MEKGDGYYKHQLSFYIDYDEQIDVWEEEGEGSHKTLDENE